jgi:hypothetical protein
MVDNTVRLAGNETMVVTGLDVKGVPHQHSPLEAQLQATLNIVPAYAWYALPNGALTFVNERTADYLRLPKDHRLRLGTHTDADWHATSLFCIRMIAKRHAESGWTVYAQAVPVR